MTLKAKTLLNAWFHINDETEIAPILTEAEIGSKSGVHDGVDGPVRRWEKCLEVERSCVE